MAIQAVFMGRMVELAGGQVVPATAHTQARMTGCSTPEGRAAAHDPRRRKLDWTWSRQVVGADGEHRLGGG